MCFQATKLCGVCLPQTSYLIYKKVPRKGVLLLTNLKHAALDVGLSGKLKLEKE